MSETTMPPSIFPLVWNFLLSSSTKQTADDSSSLDFSSIKSFLLVNSSTRQAFHACNGYSQCCTALTTQRISCYEEVEAFRMRADAFVKSHIPNSSLKKEQDICRAFLKECNQVEELCQKFYKIQARTRAIQRLANTTNRDEWEGVEVALENMMKVLRQVLQRRLELVETLNDFLNDTPNDGGAAYVGDGDEQGESSTD